MYERMLNKEVKPTIKEMTDYCASCGEMFVELNEWLSANYATLQKIVFPYGNKYGWGIGHYKKNKLICNIFAEDNAFTVMIRLSNQQWDVLYEQVQEDMQKSIEQKYPCNDSSWVHFRIKNEVNYNDIQKVLSVRLG